MKSWKTCIAWETAAKSQTGVKIGLGLLPEKKSNATGMFPNALRFP